MPTDLELAWLAGLFDGESCIYLDWRDRKISKYREVRLMTKLAMSHKETVWTAWKIVQNIIGNEYVKFEQEARRNPRTLPLWNCIVYSKLANHALLTALLPFFKTRKVEALLALRYLEPHYKLKWHRSTKEEMYLAELAKSIRNGCGKARAEAAKLVGQVIPSEVTEETCYCETCRD